MTLLNCRLEIRRLENNLNCFFDILQARESAGVLGEVAPSVNSLHASCFVVRTSAARARPRIDLWRVLA